MQVPESVKELRPHAAWDLIKEALRLMLPFLAGWGVKEWVHIYATALMWTAVFITAALIVFWDRVARPKPSSPDPAMSALKEETAIALLTKHVDDLKAEKAALAKNNEGLTAEVARLNAHRVDLLGSKLVEGKNRGAELCDTAVQDAPQLVVSYQSKSESVTLYNDGPGAIQNVDLGSLRWGSSKSITVFGSVGVIAPRTQVVRKIMFQSSPNQGTEMYHYMRTATPHDATHTVTVTYDDSKGNKFARDFELTSQIDGTITWQPRPVKLLAPAARGTPGTD